MMIVRILKLKATTFFKEVQQKVKKGRTRQRTNAVCILSVETMTLHNDFEISKKYRMKLCDKFQTLFLFTQFRTLKV